MSSTIGSSQEGDGVGVLLLLSSSQFLSMFFNSEGTGICISNNDGILLLLFLNTKLISEEENKNTLKSSFSFTYCVSFCNHLIVDEDTIFSSEKILTNFFFIFRFNQLSFHRHTFIVSIHITTTNTIPSSTSSTVKVPIQLIKHITWYIRLNKIIYQILVKMTQNWIRQDYWFLYI
ncbi:hypothetical protein AGLY_001269 [Aphis glycines]|uniref:Uncharacterized protein n=1 Tax=Aphis glycines TaxID=307491 RepID=A0A6G0UBT2_APHGL|nr:hypothetical protein AGLY_001269 [Aphis glycines]